MGNNTATVKANPKDQGKPQGNPKECLEKTPKEGETLKSSQGHPLDKSKPHQYAHVRVKDKSQKGLMPLWANFIVAGASGMLATCILHPADVLKTRMQLLGHFKYECHKVTVVQVAGQLIKKESYSGLYKGLSASLLRQFIYTSGRLGGFNAALSYHKYMNKKPPDFPRKIAMGCAAGGVGAFLSTPAEVCLVRMMADGRLPTRERRNYGNVFSGIYRIANEEGLTALWRGASATILRAVLVNGAQLATYAQAKEKLEPKMGDTLALFVTASMISGLVATAVSLPADMIKTRVQDSPESVSQLTTLQRVVVCESSSALWKGFLPAFFKIAPHTVITFLALEQFNKLYKYMVS